MAKKPEGVGNLEIKSTSSLQTSTDSREAGSGSQTSGHRGAWIREDGAVCFDNECIILKPDKDGALGLIYDADKCSCDESNAAILEALADAVISGKGIRLEIKPRGKK